MCWPEGPESDGFKMSEIFDLTNLLLLGLVVLIFFRLRGALGRKTGDEQPRLAAREARAQREPSTRPLPQTDMRPSSGFDNGSIEERLGPLPAENHALGPLRDIAAADRSFEVAPFLKGARIAYEAIVTAYARGDRETLRKLLSPEVYDSFNAVISERESRGETTEFSFVGIESADLIDAHLANGVAQITVRFVSHLVTAVRDHLGNVVEGDVKAVRQVTDVWTFERDVTLPNPNWRLVATDSPES